VIYFVSHKSYF